MGIWEAIKGAFAVGTSTPPDARRLSATNESALSASLKALRDRERGWITLSEVRALFSTMDDSTPSARWTRREDPGLPRLQGGGGIDVLSIFFLPGGGSISLE